MGRGEGEGGKGTGKREGKGEMDGRKEKGGRGGHGEGIQRGVVGVYWWMQGKCTKLFACSHGLYDYHTHSLVKSITSDEEFEHELRQTGEILVVVDFSTEW